MKKILATVLCFTVLFCLLSLLVPGLLPHVYLLQDSSFSALYPRVGIRNFDQALRNSGYYLDVRTLEDNTLTDSMTLQEELEKYEDGHMVLMSPVVTAAVRAAHVPASELVGGLAVGISDRPDSSFDIVLESDTSSGFAIADEMGVSAADYRYGLSADRETLNALVYPDFSVSVTPLLDLEKGNLHTDKGILFYDCTVL